MGLYLVFRQTFQFSIITIVCNFSKSIRFDVSPHFNYTAGLINMIQTDFKHLMGFLKYISNIPPQWTFDDTKLYCIFNIGDFMLL